jgi:uncharacterized protein YjbJ (UPF0337 family)
MAEQQPRRGASTIMTPDAFAGQWQQLRDQIRSWWGDLTDADLDKIAGKKDLLIGLVQERYGYARERAEQEVDRRLQEYSAQASGVAATVASAAQEVASRVTETAGTAATKAQEMAGAAATAVTDTVAGVGTYVQEKGLQGLSGDLTDLIRRHPVPALLVGLGIGFVLGRSVGPRPPAPGS